MVLGMATKKVTITLDAEQLQNVQKLVASGKAESVSGFVQHAVKVSLADVAGWGAMLGAALAETGGPLTRAERAWADSLINPRKARNPKKRRRAA
jgi:Arc/MetJ-type ribon-helix-helix transcriptional regulator